MSDNKMILVVVAVLLITLWAGLNRDPEKEATTQLKKATEQLIKAQAKYEQTWEDYQRTVTSRR